MGFRITTWNVNGIRNPFGYQPWRDQRTFQAMFDILEADIVIMQETKIQRKDLRDDIVLVPGWDVYFSLPRHKKGYSGVAIYTRNATCAPIRAEEGITGILNPPGSATHYRDLPKDQSIGGYPQPGQLTGEIDELALDSEGRCVLLEFPAFVLLGVYSPANRDASRDNFRKGFFEALDVRVRNLVAEGKQVVLTGDLNVTRSEIDSTNVMESLRKEGVSLDDWMAMPVRRIFNQLVFDGSVKGARDEGRERPVLWDLCRSYHPERQGMNTCWDTKKNTRPANNGSRIDYILCSDGLRSWFTDADVQQGLMGSDHCPVFAILAETVTLNDHDVPLLELLNPPTMFQHGKRIRDWQKKDLLPLSAKLMTNFDRRQSIRDMFTKRASPSAAKPVVIATNSTNTSVLETQVDAVATHDNDKTDGLPEKRISGAGAASCAAFEAEDPLGVPVVPKTVPTVKRPPETTTTVTQQRKRAKVSNVGCKIPAGQTTLQGFFKAKPPASPLEKKITDETESIEPAVSPSVKQNIRKGSLHTIKTEADTTPVLSAGVAAGDLLSSDRVFDAVESKDQWSKLLKKRAVPRCEHNEPCISLTTKKAGINRGRSFYICPRPLGPSGEKEKDSEWRCGTFIWSSDWNGSSVQ